MDKLNPNEKILEIVINYNEKTDKAQVLLKSKDKLDFIHWMTACEYLLHKVSELSPQPYKKAMKILCEGAKTYKNLKG